MLRQAVVFAGYVYATAQELMHVDLVVQVSPSGWTVSNIPSTALVYGDCSAFPAVAVQLSVGIDQAKLGIGLAAALLSGFPLIGWSVRHQPWRLRTHDAFASCIALSCKHWQLRFCMTPLALNAL